MSKIPELEPMSDAELSKIKGQVERRWEGKPWYGFDPSSDPMGSPMCTMRAHEVLRMIKRVENSIHSVELSDG